MKPWNLQRTFWPAVLALVFFFFLFEWTPLDLLVQDLFYNFKSGRWLVDAKAPLPRALFYDGVKGCIILLGLILIGLSVSPKRWLERMPVPSPARRRLFVAILTIATVPAFVGQLKSWTNVYYPSRVDRYGGDVPYVTVLEKMPEDRLPAKRSRGWPAGHASGGFALLGLAALAATRRGQIIGIGIGLSIGSLMGFYQIAKGAHYLSHTIVTAFIAWIGFLLWQRLILYDRKERIQPTGQS